jgi:hypothetical protein
MRTNNYYAVTFCFGRKCPVPETHCVKCKKLRRKVHKFSELRRTFILALCCSGKNCVSKYG